MEVINSVISLSEQFCVDVGNMMINSPNLYLETNKAGCKEQKVRREPVKCSEVRQGQVNKKFKTLKLTWEFTDITSFTPTQKIKQVKFTKKTYFYLGFLPILDHITRRMAATMRLNSMTKG